MTNERFQNIVDFHLCVLPTTVFKSFAARVNLLVPILIVSIQKRSHRGGLRAQNKKFSIKKNSDLWELSVSAVK